MNRFSFKKERFYKDDEKEPFFESFLVNANDEVTFSDNLQMLSGVYFQLEIYKKSRDFHVDIELLSWSNSEQKYVWLKNSIWSEDSFGKGAYIPIIQAHYKKLIYNFFAALDTLKYHWQIKDLVYRIKHPTFIFHYKLLNLFSQKELEQIMLKHMCNYPILNISLFSNAPKRGALKYAFLPHIIDGFYIDGIEVSVDLNQSDIPLIEDIDSGVISKNELLTRLNI